MQRILMTTPLEDVRQRLYVENRVDFAARLGITTQTYRRLVGGDPSISIETRRQVAERLGTAPHLIPELIPPPSEQLLRLIGDEIAEANRSGGWMTLNSDGSLTPAPDALCPPGQDD
jgi:transcriptional regulator with XRE-family HTH domain